MATEENGRDVFANLHAFGLIDNTCTPEIITGGTHYLLARNLHDVYVQQQRVRGDTLKTNAMMVSWDSLPEEIRQSNLAAADAIGRILHSQGFGLTSLTDWSVPFTLEFTPEETDNLARLEHDRFVKNRLARGWVYAPGPKNNEARTNPSLLPWMELPEMERDKDRDFVRNWPLNLGLAGFEIIKPLREKR